MDDEECLNRYGTPLEPLEKDEVPAKKPLAIEDQIVKDENGKRRFHGAFTGGFSAGFWNTVGSLEGWTPQSFKSSRAERAQQRSQQRPEDFMDQEDLGEFGIAPQGIRTREEFAKDGDGESGAGSRKRKLMQPNSLGPIPGKPVLEQLLKPVRDKVAVRILKSMGWKPGQGVGPRQTRKEKKQAKERNTREQYLQQHYGCGEEDGLRVGDANNVINGDVLNDEDDDDDEEEEEELTFAPDDYEPLFYNVKDNRFGLSYTGLSRAPVLSKGDGGTIATPSQHINLFGPLEVMDKSKKLSILGQAFGVGALEEEDEDIYARDDMTRYDFSLGGKNKPKQKKLKHVQDRSVIEGFAEDKASLTYHEPYVIDLPRDFKPRNWAVRRSRFAPLEATRAKQFEADNEYKKTGLGRHDLDPEKRAKLLGEEVPPPNEKKMEGTKKSDNAATERTKALLERISATSSNFTRGGLITAEGEEKPAVQLETREKEASEPVQQENAKLLERAAAKTKHLDTAGGFKPFLGDDAKQTRYDKFLASNLRLESEIAQFLHNLQPVTLSAWDREMEMKEFIQARNIYKPLGGIMSDRFVTESVVKLEEVKQAETLEDEKKIVMERTKCMWKPSALLCKRYNIADPFGGALEEPRKITSSKPKLSIFDYLEASINTKANFQTPVIIPKHVEHAKASSSLTTTASLATTASLTTTTTVTEAEPPPPGTTNEAVATTDETPPAHVPKLTKSAPKTELEQRVDESRNKPISEKTELFKSIFDDSDPEEEKESQNIGASTTAALDSKTAAEERRAAMRAQLGLPPIVPIHSTTNAAAANVLRNDSPPRGIFASLFKPPVANEQKEPVKEVKNPEDTKKDIPKQTNVAVPPKIEFKSRAERQKSEQQQVDELETTSVDVYGPKVPESIQPTITTKITSNNSASTDEHDIDAKLLQLWRQKRTLEVPMPPAKKSKKSVEEEWIEKRLPSSDDSDSDSTATSSSSSSDEEDKRLKKKKKSNKKSKKRKSAVDRKSKKKGKKSKSKQYEKTHKSEKKKKKKNKK